MSTKFSIIVPVFNEAGNVLEFYTQISTSLGSYNWELIFINDGSTDETLSIAKGISDPKVRVLSFVQNCGHQKALDAGYRHASGDFIVCMDGDLQHPIDVLVQMIEMSLRDPHDVIYAVREKRSDDRFMKRLSARIYYSLLRWLSGVDIRTSAADFRLISRRVLNVLNQLPEGGIVFRLAIPSFGFPSKEIKYVASARFSGRSKYSVAKMIKLFNESVLTSSIKPLGLGIQLGLIMAVISFFGFIYALVVYLIGNSLPGWTSIISATLMMFGVIFLLLGIIGVYLGQVVLAVRKMPTYILDEISKTKNGGGLS